MSFRFVPKLVTLNGEMALIQRYFTDFGSFWGALRKSGQQSHNHGQFTITMTYDLRLLCLVVIKRLLESSYMTSYK